MKLDYCKPKSPRLQQYLEGYYFLSNTERDITPPYLTFPNNYSIISICSNVALTFSEHQVIASASEENSFSSDLICNYQQPIKVIYQGRINELTFCFKPLGLNAFLDQPLTTFTSGFFSKFIPYPDYEQTMRCILLEHERTRQIDMIEEYWLSKLTGFKHPFLANAVSDLLNNNGDYTIAEIAARCNTSRQHLRKHFELHLGKTPSAFRKIERFRQALKQHAGSNESLTSLSYDLLFYDQSHLIKDFKSLTGLSPKAFFGKLLTHDSGNVNWIFIS